MKSRKLTKFMILGPITWISNIIQIVLANFQFNLARTQIPIIVLIEYNIISLI